MEHRHDVTVYYEDTDSLGVVYYANYLKYLERGRTELVGAAGRPIGQWNAEGYFFVVYEVQLRYLKPARLGDRCQVVTRVSEGTSHRRILEQRVERDGETLTEAKVTLVCLDRNLALQEFPPGLLEPPAPA